MAMRLRVVVDREDSLGRASGRRSVGGSGRGGGRLAGERQREGEACAPTKPGALGPDAPAMRLDQPPADGESEPGVVATGRPGVLVKKACHALGWNPPPLVHDRHRHMHTVVGRLQPDWRGRRRMPRGVGQQVGQQLLDALAVGHRTRQIKRQVDAHRVPPAAREEGVARSV